MGASDEESRVSLFAGAFSWSYWLGFRWRLLVARLLVAAEAGTVSSIDVFLYYLYITYFCFNRLFCFGGSFFCLYRYRARPFGVPGRSCRCVANPGTSWPFFWCCWTFCSGMWIFSNSFGINFSPFLFWKPPKRPLDLGFLASPRKRVRLESSGGSPAGSLKDSYNVGSCFLYVLKLFIYILYLKVGSLFWCFGISFSRGIPRTCKCIWFLSWFFTEFFKSLKRPLDSAGFASPVKRARTLAAGSFAAFCRAEFRQVSVGLFL